MHKRFLPLLCLFSLVLSGCTFSPAASRPSDPGRANTQTIATEKATDSSFVNPDFLSSLSGDGEFEAKRCDDHVTSFLRVENLSAGGDYDQCHYSGLNFETNTGRLLGLDDIADDKDALLKDAKTFILSQLDLMHYGNIDRDSKDNISSILDDQIMKDGTWYFTNSGICFIANADVLKLHGAIVEFFCVPYRQLGSLKPEYYYTGPFELSALLGSTVTADLDGNEDMDAVFYDCREDEETGTVLVSFTINGTDFSSKLQESCFLSAGATDSISDMCYYIADLDTSDEFCEIAILDHGDSDDLATHFFRYDRGNLSYLGCIPDLFGQTCSANGDGTLNADIPLNILETVRIPVSYQLNDGQLKLVKQDWYSIDEEAIPEDYRNHDILEDVIVYTENDLHSDTVTLTPQDGPVSFPATDNEHWVVLKTSNDKRYYLYFEDIVTLNSGQDAQDVFSDILLAG